MEEIYFKAKCLPGKKKTALQTNWPSVGHDVHLGFWEIWVCCRTLTDFFLFLQACSSGWPFVGPRGRMREWELDPTRCKSTAAGLFLPWLGRIERFCVFWCGFFFSE